MTEEISEETTPEIKFQDNGVVLSPNRWGRYSDLPSEINRYLTLKSEIETKMAAGEPVYVQILDERRKGSVGRLGSITFDYRPSGSPRNYYYNRNSTYLGFDNIEVIWDKRKNKCSPTADEIEYLPNWTGGTHWEWHPGETKEKEPKVIPYDSLGQEIETGQFVCFVHKRYGITAMKFGTVTRTTPKGGVFVKTLKLRDGERAGEELRAYSASDLLIVNDKLMGRLMMARLAAD